MARDERPEVALGQRPGAESGVDGVPEYVLRRREVPVQSSRRVPIGDGDEYQSGIPRTPVAFECRHGQSANEIGDVFAVDEQRFVGLPEAPEHTDGVDTLRDWRGRVRRLREPAVEDGEGAPARANAVVPTPTDWNGVECAVSHDGPEWSPAVG
jgi:hypothetical protein